MKKRKVKTPLKRNRVSIAEQLRQIPAGSKQEWPLSDVNVSSYRTKVGEENVKAGYSKYSLRTIPDYNIMVITNRG